MDSNTYYDDEVTYSDMLEDFDHNELVNVAYWLGMTLDFDRLDAMRHRQLRQAINDFVHTHPDEWLAALPVVDLQMLHLLTEQSRCAMPDTMQTMLIENLGIVSVTAGDSTDDCALCADIKPLVEDRVAPLVAKKIELGHDVLETAMRGLLNLTGFMTLGTLRRLMSDVLSHKADKRFADAAIAKFLDRSMLTRFAIDYGDTDRDPVAYSCATDINQWEPELRDLEPRYPTSYDDVMAHGTYPYFTPSMQCEKDFCDTLRQLSDLDDERVLDEFTYIFLRLQEPDLRPTDLMRELSEVCSLDNMKEIAAMIEALLALANGIPKYYLRGHTSADVHAGPGQSAAGPSPARPAASRAPRPAAINMPLPRVGTPKVDRNAPCPCGSGKKYKHCHGK